MVPNRNCGWDVYVSVKKLRIFQESAFWNSLLSRFLLGTTGFAHFKVPSDIENLAVSSGEP